MSKSSGGFLLFARRKNRPAKSWRFCAAGCTMMRQPNSARRLRSSVKSCKPASGVPVRLERQDPAGKWSSLRSGQTDQDGRCRQLLPEGATLTQGVYRLTFDTSRYFAACGVEGFYPVVDVTFEVRDGE